MNDLFGIVTILGFWGWVSCTVAFIVKAFPAKDLFAGNAARKWGSGIIIFYALWIYGMLNA